MSDILREIYRYIRHILEEIYRQIIFPKYPSANMLRMGEDWESCTCHLVSHPIDIFYLLDGSSKLTRIITYFPICEHEKLRTTFFTRYFPFPSFYHKNLRFYLKLLRTIIYSLELEKLIITFFQEKNEKM